MAMGRGSCMRIVLLAFLVVCCWIGTIASTTHVVGDSNGWGFSVSYSDWANGRPFAVGDTLVFNYEAGQHNVVPVGAAGYRSCKADSSSKAFSSGKDKFTLKKGANLFICSLPGHCQAGMKIQVNAN